MIVYRDGRRSLDLAALAREIAADVRAGDVVSALIGAGELECALADLGDPAEASAAALTDRLADALVADRAPDPEPPLDVPVRSARGSVPEGFAYYGLHPLDHAAAALRAAPADGATVLVVGARSIGTTLSASAAAALRARGTHAPRVTVRPGGHPFARSLVLEGAAREATREAARSGATVLVADEGPGISGSTFLSIADALVEAGVARGSIVLLPSHDPDPARLAGRDAAARWSALRREVAWGTRPAPPGIDISAGAWRDVLSAPGAPRPVAWPSTERRKVLAPGAIHKLEGLGRYGASVVARAERLADAGIGPAVTPEADGWARYARAPGAAMRRGDAPPIDAIARRVAALEPVGSAAVAHGALDEMVRTNVRELLAIDLDRVDLPIERPRVVDGRMQPWEWIRDGERVLKVDAASHGDDHFFPGPCDAAWDVAGAAVEWDLDEDGGAALVAAVARASGDRGLAPRMLPWTIAYCAFRAGWLSTARDACADTPDHEPLAREAVRVGRRLARAVESYRRSVLPRARG